MRSTVFTAALIGLVALPGFAASPGSRSAQGPEQALPGAHSGAWTITAGASHVVDDHQPGEIGFEYRFAQFQTRPIRAIAGFSTNDLASYWGYAGLRYEWRPGFRVTIAPSFAIVLYEKGDGRDLGGPLQFRSAIDLSTRIGQRHEIGFSFSHLSNGHFYSFNPGTESLVLTWTIAHR